MDEEPPEEYLTFSEFLALWVGSEKTLRRRLKDGSIPKYQPGGPGTLIAIPRSALRSLANAKPNSDGQKTSTQIQEAQIPGPKPRWRKTNAK